MHVARLLGAVRRHAGRSQDEDVWEGPCFRCGRLASVGERDDHGSAGAPGPIGFWDLECMECAQDRLLELEHIARAASDLEFARIRREMRSAGIFRGPAWEESYARWCLDRGLEPLPPRTPAHS